MGSDSLIQNPTKAFLEPEIDKKVDYIDDLPSSNHPKFNEETIYLTN